MRRGETMVQLLIIDIRALRHVYLATRAWQAASLFVVVWAARMGGVVCVFLWRVTVGGGCRDRVRGWKEARAGAGAAGGGVRRAGSRTAGRKPEILASGRTSFSSGLM